MPFSLLLFQLFLARHKVSDTEEKCYFGFDMWFWSVSWSTNCPVYFSPFFGRPKKNCSVSGNFWSGSDFFWSTKFLFGIPKFLFSIPKNQSLTKKYSETDQKFPETVQFFFGRPKKVRNRPDNWSTKRLTKTTWTGLLVSEFFLVRL